MNREQVEAAFDIASDVATHIQDRLEDRIIQAQSFTPDLIRAGRHAAAAAGILEMLLHDSGATPSWQNRYPDLVDEFTADLRQHGERCLRHLQLADDGFKKIGLPRALPGLAKEDGEWTIADGAVSWRDMVEKAQHLHILLHE